MNRDDRSVLGQAVIAYGTLTLLLPFAAALYWSAKWAALAFVGVAALTYLYQLLVFSFPDEYTKQHKGFVRGGCLMIWFLWDVAFVLLLKGV